MHTSYTEIIFDFPTEIPAQVSPNPLVLRGHVTLKAQYCRWRRYICGGAYRKQGIIMIAYLKLLHSINTSKVEI